MSKFTILIVALVIGAVGYITFVQKSKPKETILGISHSVQNRDHIPKGKSHPAYNSDPPSSGWHYSDSESPTPWGVYTQEVPDEVFIHNEEHGGIIVTYRPDLSADQIKKLQGLFAPPYSDTGFKPIKAIVTPRSKNTHPIELAAWTYTLNLGSFDQTILKKFYLQHVSQSPEATAGPTNTPINQALQP